MRIERAHKEDAQTLSDLTFRAKSYWNYSKEQLKRWEDDLTISTAYIDRNDVFKLILHNKIIAYYSYQFINNKVLLLDNIFVDPEYIGKGYGKTLMNHLIKEAIQARKEKIKLESEPNAAAFYKKMGFKIVGQLESSIKNRYLPIMELDIDADL